MYLKKSPLYLWGVIKVRDFNGDGQLTTKEASDDQVEEYLE